jgi:hypothetical protein
MKTILLTIAVWMLTAGVSYGQIGELSSFHLRVGKTGVPVHILARVVQVINGNRMLVAIEDVRWRGRKKFDRWVMVECSTKGITDGKFWTGRDWENITGSKVLTVSDTMQYTTAGGATKTVFVLRPVSQKELAKLVEAASYRTWTIRGTKKTFVGQYIKVKTGRVHIRPKDGKAFEIRLSRLVKKDQKWIKAERKRLKDEKRKERKRQKGEKQKGTSR